MFDETEQLEKDAAGKAAEYQNCTGRLCDGPPGEPRRPSLVERVYIERRHAERQVERAMVLAELEHLLEKHPEVARILDLVELVR